MAWKSLEDAGYILKNNQLPEESGMREVATFLQQMAETFAQLSVDFITSSKSFTLLIKSARFSQL